MEVIAKILAEVVLSHTRNDAANVFETPPENALVEIGKEREQSPSGA